MFLGFTYINTYKHSDKHSIVTTVYCNALLLLDQPTCIFNGIPFSITSFKYCHLDNADNTIMWQISKTAHTYFSVLE